MLGKSQKQKVLFVDFAVDLRSSRNWSLNPSAWLYRLFLVHLLVDKATNVDISFRIREAEGCLNVENSLVSYPIARFHRLSVI